MSTQTVSKQTQKNWWVDAALLFSAVAAALSGIYFLFLPSGYQGGRNPLYNIQILFSRQTWDDLHTWTGVPPVGARRLLVSRYPTSRTIRRWPSMLRAATSHLSSPRRIPERT